MPRASQFCCYDIGMGAPQMIPLGYMLKHVTSPAPDWAVAPLVTAVHSVSNCVSPDFGNYIPIWQHNGWWFFDTADKARSAAETLGVPTETLSLFYYEAYHRQFDDTLSSWAPFEPDDFPTAVVPPIAAIPSGFDVVTFAAGTSPECSPLSCNRLASSVAVNQRCLFHSFDEAQAVIESGGFRNTEPGPYRIIAVYLVDA